MAKISDADYKKAIEIWKKENPDKDYIDMEYGAGVEVDGRIIRIGKRVSLVRSIYKAMQEGRKIGNNKDLTEEEIAYWDSLGILTRKREMITEAEYRKAIEIWKKENPDKDYSEISKRTIVEVDGKKIQIGDKIKRMRSIYNGKKDENHNLTEEQIAYWESLGLLKPSKRIRTKITEEEYREAVKIWKEENPDEDYTAIKHDVKIEVNGKLIPLGVRVNEIRQIYKAMEEGKKHGTCKNLTEEQVAYWGSLGLLEAKKITEEEYRQAVEVWKRENPSKEYLTIVTTTKIEINGKKIPLGRKISLNRRIYKAMQNGSHYETYKDLTEEQIEYWTNQGMIWDYDEYKKSQKNNSDTKKQSQLEKYIEVFNGDKEKAERVVKCLSDLREKRKARKKEDYNIGNILKEFDVDIETLKKYFSRTHSKETVERSKSLEYQGLTLRKFCINNGYNYDVIIRAIKLHEFCHNDTLEQLINRSITTYQKKGQKEPATWVYEKYGNLVKHILLYLRLDASKILTDMSNYTISLEEAIRHNVFLQTKKTKEQEYLEEVYNYLIEEIDLSKTEGEMIEDIISKYQELTQEYRFTKDEHEVVIASFERYIKTIKEYQKADVGLETNETRKIEKIKDYGLEPEDIEESYFIPLEFDNKVLLGRKSELYLRRQLLRQYIIDWDFYTEEEKEVIKLKNQFTEEEIRMIESTRRGINEIIEKTR